MNISVYVNSADATLRALKREGINARTGKRLGDAVEIEIGDSDEQAALDVAQSITAGVRPRRLPLALVWVALAVVVAVFMGYVPMALGGVGLGVVALSWLGLGLFRLFADAINMGRFARRQLPKQPKESAQAYRQRARLGGRMWWMPFAWLLVLLSIMVGIVFLLLGGG